ncbi:MAG: hypothetical protein PHS37_08495 [Candidatus Omnitrophica bacterium]|nr:hypothetical protein [Candidatus Omnitrophota bacterium]
MALWIKRLLGIVIGAAIIVLPGSVGCADNGDDEEIGGESYDEVETVEVEETLPDEVDEGDDADTETIEIDEEVPVSVETNEGTVTTSTVHTSTTYVRGTSPTVADTVVIGAVAGSVAASAAKDAAKKNKEPAKKVIKKVKTEKADITVEVKPTTDVATKK